MRQTKNWKKLLVSVLILLLLSWTTVYAEEESDDPIPPAKPYNEAQLTGNYIEDLIYIANTQLNYSSNDSNETCYSVEVGSDSASEWCSEFATWCLIKARVPQSLYPIGKSYNTFREWGSARGSFYTVNHELASQDSDGCREKAAGRILQPEEIRPGDIILMNGSKFANGMKHTAISVSRAYKSGSTWMIKTIEGNIDDGYVHAKSRKVALIHGIFRPDYASKCNQMGHNWDAGVKTAELTKTTDGNMLYTCRNCQEQKNEPIHQPVADPEIKATCISNGWTAGSHCGHCGAVIVARSIIPKLPLHTEGATLTDTVTKAVYQVTTAGYTGGTVTYMAPTNKKIKSLSIKESVTIDGIQYAVTAIAANAFNKCTKLKKIVIPSTIQNIGTSAFEGCKNLRQITVKSKLLKKSSVGAKAFKGIYKKAVFKVPSSKRSKYKTIFRKKGAGNGTSFK